MQSSLLNQVDITPPYIVRRMTRKSARQLAVETGLHVMTIQRYARLRSWSTLSIRNAEAFAIACGHDLIRPRKTIQYLRWHARTGKGFGYLNLAAKRQFNKLLKRYGT